MFHACDMIGKQDLPLLVEVNVSQLWNGVFLDLDLIPYCLKKLPRAFSTAIMRCNNSCAFYIDVSYIVIYFLPLLSYFLLMGTLFSSLSFVSIYFIIFIFFISLVTLLRFTSDLDYYSRLPFPRTVRGHYSTSYFD